MLDEICCSTGLECAGGGKYGELMMISLLTIGVLVYRQTGRGLGYAYSGLELRAAAGFGSLSGARVVLQQQF